MSTKSGLLCIVCVHLRAKWWGVRYSGVSNVLKSMEEQLGVSEFCGCPLLRAEAIITISVQH